MRETLAALEAGELSVEAAHARLRGYTASSAGRFDTTRRARTGVPEAILADAKEPDEVGELAAVAVETTGRALLTRIDETRVEAVKQALTDRETTGGGTALEFDRNEPARTLVVRAADFERPDLDAVVGVVSAGTADAGPASEAAVTAREIGATVTRIDDVGVAGLARTLDAIPDFRHTDALVVAAGREGALPTVIAGLVSTPVIALPVSVGYGHGGAGEAALAGSLQSCAPLVTVNIDAGFVAGAHAGRIARAIDGARHDDATGRNE
jgi:pyridinium-3,5-biscarboxylic acid mononucleotide synthase